MMQLLQKAAPSSASYATEKPRNARTNPAPDVVKKNKKMREELSEQKIDKTLKDSFPASDPPAWY